MTKYENKLLKRDHNFRLKLNSIFLKLFGALLFIAIVIGMFALIIIASENPENLTYLYMIAVTVISCFAIAFTSLLCNRKIINVVIGVYDFIKNKKELKDEIINLKTEIKKLKKENKSLEKRISNANAMINFLNGSESDGSCIGV